MNQYHLYNIYGIIVRANVALPLIKELEGGSIWELDLDIQYNKVTFEENIILINQSDNVFFVRLGNIAEYCIFVKQNKITCIAKNFESFFSTLFNIPFSVYFATRGDILLHACSMQYRNELICFSGEKGVGKSTLTKILNGVEFLLYADDTLRITKDLRGYRAHSLIKLTLETVEEFNIKEITNVENITKKLYGMIESSDNVVRVASIISIKRTNQTLKIINVSNDVIKKYIFFNNIVGVNYFSRTLLRIVLENFINNVKYFELTLPDDLQKLRLSREDIISLLSSSMSE